ncbi:transposase [Streptomyces asiaticus]|uniref:transposase n=1 Tax=Streptomyces asiaticus TaxID=114695 RepID=UPI003D750BC0
MGSQYSNRYSEEFKRDAIALARSSEKTITEVARDLGVSPESLRGWVNRDRIDQGGGTLGELTSAEREELRRLRRQNAEQQKTIEILKKATAFFAKDSDRRARPTGSSLRRRPSTRWPCCAVSWAWSAPRSTPGWRRRRSGRPGLGRMTCLPTRSP